MKPLHRIGSFVSCVLWAATGLAQDQTHASPVAYEALERAVVHPTVEAAAKRREAAGVATSGTTSLLTYHGGTSDGKAGVIGVETAPQIYLVLWGNQWSNDPSGEAAILKDFLAKVGGSSWLASVTQYCQGITSGSTVCASNSAVAEASPAYLVSSWSDNSSAAPTQPRQSDIAAEAVRAAAHFSVTGANLATAQFVIATAHNNNSSGFGTQYCAYHSYTTSTLLAGKVAYTNLPYITDAGASCGANFNGLGPLAGITIVEGHELGETITDQFPSTGWLDSGGAENGDKCAWISSGSGASANVTFGATTYPVQTLWSNAANAGGGGCVLSYP